MTGACQGDAAGSSGFFSPDFMCRLLVHIASSDIAEPFMASLPVMGRDGTLWDIQLASSAAGRVRAKTGTMRHGDCLRRGLLFSAKGLAGYVDGKSGRRLAFTTYLANFNRMASSDLDPGQVLGELASAIYEYL
jgi:D-alanyl-D-alanine carboxypeptidase/D-alanyl-D-alanine-endopeptidase (penicillin-binding protein 4)